MKLANLLVLSGLSLALFVGANMLSAKLPSPIPEQALAGKRVWQKHNCVSCHTLFGNGGYEAADLTNIVATIEPSQLVTYLVQPPVMRPNKYTHHPALRAGEAKSLVKYLEYVHTIPTLGWPPKPAKGGSGS